MGLNCGEVLRHQKHVVITAIFKAEAVVQRFGFSPDSETPIELSSEVKDKSAGYHDLVPLNW